MQRPREGVCTAPRFVPGCGQTCWDRALNCRQQGASSPLRTLSLPGPEFHSLRRAPSAALHQGLPQQSSFQGPAQALDQKVLVVALCTEATPKTSWLQRHRGNSKSPSRAELLGKDIQPLLAVQRPRRSIGSEALSSTHSHIHSLIHTLILAC